MGYNAVLLYTEDTYELAGGNRISATCAGAFRRQTA